MHTVTKFEAEKVGEEILLSMEVTSGDNVWPGRKVVAADADLKVEADILAAEIVDASTANVSNPAPVSTPIDVSKITVEIKTLEEAMAAKPKPVVEAPVEEPVI